MLQKKPLGGKRFQVTFTAPSIPGVETLHLCGEFNGWSETANPMRREPDGSWSATLSLEGGKSYMFRYRDDSGAWHNDWAADAYVPNQFGSENSVLDLAAQEVALVVAPEKRRPQNSPVARAKPMARGPQKRRRG
jgi:1,4-alpha-glucan branching enzyme